MKATPTPWQARPPIDDLGATINGQAVGPVPATICRVYRNEEGMHSTRFIAEIYNGDTDEGAANAALIVTAVNNVDRLKEALKYMIAAHEPGAGAWHKEAALSEASAALKAAAQSGAQR